MDLIINLLQKTFVVTLEIVSPILLIGMVVGLTISVFQTVTQIQEATLTFVPKIIAGIIALIVLLPWLTSVFITSINEFYDLLPELIKG